MKLALVGVGDAGGRIVNRILAFEEDSGRTFCRGNVLVFNTARTAFDGTEHVPEDRRVLLGDTHQDVEGRGADGDPELAVEVARESLNGIRRAFDDVEPHEVDGILLVAGLGGATGGGAGAVLLEELRAMYEKPVYALGVLPAEAEGGRPALTAARSLQSFVTTADNVILFDNDAWHPDGGSYEGTNDELATRVVTLLAAGELPGTTVAENVIDTSDIIRTLDTAGVSSIGYASTEVGTGGGLLRGLLDRFRGGPDDDTTDAARVKGLVRRAVSSRLTLPCEVSSAERALVVLSGPPAELSLRGFESARHWIEGEADTVEVLAGDEPREGSPTLVATVLLSNVTEVPRIDAMQAQAVDARPREITERGAARDDEGDA